MTFHVWQAQRCNGGQNSSLSACGQLPMVKLLGAGQSAANLPEDRENMRQAKGNKACIQIWHSCWFNALKMKPHVSQARHSRTHRDPS